MLKVFFGALIYPIKVLWLDLVYMYKFFISPMLSHTCRFYPTCSSYMLIAINEWGIIKGVWLGLCRICRCRPKGNYGYDFVPTNLKGELKWIY